MRLTRKLKREYQELYSTLEINASRFNSIDITVDKILQNRSSYEDVAESVSAPWYFVAAIHNMESNLNFRRHLHNGDPLRARTRHVPANRPLLGEPPFSWQESAIDALKLRHIERVQSWGLVELLFHLEGYNGWGYRQHHTHVKSPYLWSFSNHYKRGKYIADGTWSDSAVSRQGGAVAIIRRLEQRNEISILTGRLPTKPVLKYAKRKTSSGEGLQRFLNSFDGVSLRVDGWPGGKTSDVVKKIFGFYLHGDPRQ